MAAYNNFILTDQGIRLLGDLMNGNGELEFRFLAVGSGSYTAQNSVEEIRSMKELKEERQRVLFSSIETAEDGFVNLKANLTNKDLEEGYPMTEAGIYAGKKGEQEEILYCVSTVDNHDYMPDYSSRQIYNVIFKMLISIRDVSSPTISYKTDVYALAEDLQSEKDRAAEAEDALKKDIASEAARASGAEDDLQRRKMDIDGDASDVTVEFREAEDLVLLNGLHKLSELFGASAKAVSSLIAHLEDKNNPHEISREQMQVDKVDNTSDMEKPVSTAQQAALDAIHAQLTAYADKAIADLINGAPSTLDTLGEIADAMEENADVVSALSEAIGKKANAAEFDSHAKDAVKHVTAAERDKWNNGSHNYGTCTTAAATAAKTVSCAGFKLAAGAEVTVKFTATNTAAKPTLNVNNTGAKAVYYRGSAVPAGYLAANRTYTFRYNGTQWDLVGDVNTDTNNLVSQTNSSADADYRILFSGTADDTTRTEGARKSGSLTYDPARKTLKGDSIELRSAENTDGRSAKITGDGMYFFMPEGGYSGGIGYIQDGELVGVLGRWKENDGHYFFCGKNYDNPDGIFRAGILQAGSKASLFTDNEGGNLRLVSPNGITWEIDAYNDNLRFFRYAEGSLVTGAGGFEITKDGVLNVPGGIAGIGYLGSTFGQLGYGAITYYGHVTAYGLSGTVILKIGGRVEERYSMSDTDFDLGINLSDILSRLGLNPYLNIADSQAAFFNGDGTFNTRIYGYGAFFSLRYVDGQKILTPARYYTADGVGGSWASTAEVYSPGTVWTAEVVLR